jgi:hypothetical protein
MLWPGNDPPMAEEIRIRLEQWGNVAPDPEGAAAEDTIWSFWLDLADRPVSHLIWCEPFEGPHLRLLDRMKFRDSLHEAEVRSCRWLVGHEGPLSLRHPNADYQLQLRIAEAISRDWSPAFFDASGFVFRSPREIKHLIASKTPPRTSTLYSIHRVSNGIPTDDEPEKFWLHTHGLQRAGVPDLDLLDVPAPLVCAAGELLETVASLWIHYQTPEPETPFAIGQGIDISWRPWQVVAEERDHRANGGWKFRTDEWAHTGYRAVLFASQPTILPGGGKIWNTPSEVLFKLTQPETTLFRSAYETRRMASLAQERWSSFGMLFAGRRPADWRFAVKLRYGDDNGSRGEHLWFEVLGIRPGRIQARLISFPTMVHDLEIGQAGWHDLARMSDWRVLTPQGTYDPETADELFACEARWAELGSVHTVL